MSDKVEPIYLGMYVHQNLRMYTLTQHKLSSTGSGEFQECTDEELKTLGLQRYHESQKIPKATELNVALHRIVTLPDGTEFDLEHIVSIGPVLQLTPEQYTNAPIGAMIPDQSNTYVVEFRNGKTGRFSNQKVPRDILIKLWKGELQ